MGRGAFGRAETGDASCSSGRRKTAPARTVGYSHPEVRRLAGGCRPPLNPSRSNGRRAKQPRGAVTGVGVVQQRAQSDLTRLRLAARGIPADDRIRHGAELQPCFRFGDRGITSATSAGRALCHGCGSRVGPVVLTAGDRQIVRSPQRRPPTDDRQLARPLFHKDEPRNTGDADLPSLLSRFRSRARRRRPTSATTAELCEPRRVAAEAREVAAGGFLMDAGPGT
jgi:hypothetical protein